MKFLYLLAISLSLMFVIVKSEDPRVYRRVTFQCDYARNHRDAIAIPPHGSCVLDNNESSCSLFDDACQTKLKECGLLIHEAGEESNRIVIKYFIFSERFSGGRVCCQSFRDTQCKNATVLADASVMETPTYTSTTSPPDTSTTTDVVHSSEGTQGTSPSSTGSSHPSSSTGTPGTSPSSTGSSHPSPSTDGMSPCKEGTAIGITICITVLITSCIAVLILVPLTLYLKQCWDHRHLQHRLNSSDGTSSVGGGGDSTGNGGSTGSGGGAATSEGANSPSYTRYSRIRSGDNESPNNSLSNDSHESQAAHNETSDTQGGPPMPPQFSKEEDSLSEEESVSDTSQEYVFVAPPFQGLRRRRPPVPTNSDVPAAPLPSMENSTTMKEEQAPLLPPMEDSISVEEENFSVESSADPLPENNALENHLQVAQEVVKSEEECDDQEEVNCQRHSPKESELVSIPTKEKEHTCTCIKGPLPGAFLWNYGPEIDDAELIRPLTEYKVKTGCDNAELVIGCRLLAPVPRRTLVMIPTKSSVVKDKEASLVIPPLTSLPSSASFTRCKFDDEDSLKFLPGESKKRQLLETSPTPNQAELLTDNKPCSNELQVLQVPTPNLLALMSTICQSYQDIVASSRICDQVLPLPKLLILPETSQVTSSIPTLFEPYTGDIAGVCKRPHPNELPISKALPSSAKSFSDTGLPSQSKNSNISDYGCSIIAKSIYGEKACVKSPFFDFTWYDIENDMSVAHACKPGENHFSDFRLLKTCDYRTVASVAFLFSLFDLKLLCWIQEQYVAICLVYYMWQQHQHLLLHYFIQVFLFQNLCYLTE